MYEKISEIPIREEKVKRLKEKILKEIEIEIERCKNGLIYLLTEKMDDETFEYITETLHQLYKLRDYVNWERSFMCDIKKYYDQDIIIYNVSIKLINLWLEDDFDFVNTFLFNIEYDCLTVEHILNDKYFGIDFTGTITECLYDKKLKEKNNNEYI